MYWRWLMWLDICFWRELFSYCIDNRDGGQERIVEYQSISRNFYRSQRWWWSGLGWRQRRARGGLVLEGQGTGLLANSLQGKREDSACVLWVCLEDRRHLKISFALLKNVNTDFSSNMHWNSVIKLRARMCDHGSKTGLLGIEYFAYLTHLLFKSTWLGEYYFNHYLDEEAKRRSNCLQSLLGSLKSQLLWDKVRIWTQAIWLPSLST